MSDDPQPDRQPQSLDLPLYIRPITRLQPVNEIATAWMVNLGVLRQSANLVDPWMWIHTGKPSVPTFTFLVLRPLVVRELLRYSEREYSSTERNTDASASIDGNGNTELKVHHILRRETRRTARSTNVGDARSLRSDAARVLRAGPPSSNEMPRLVPDDTTRGGDRLDAARATNTHSMDGTIERTDRTENTSPLKVIRHVRKRTFVETESQPSSSSDSQSTILARTLHMAHTDSPRSVAPPPLTARMTPPVRSNAVRRLPALSMAAADPAQSPAGRGIENGPAGPTAWTKSPDIDTDAPTEDVTTGVRDGPGREEPPMRVRRTGTGTQATSSSEHTIMNDHGYSHGYDSGGPSNDSPPQARDSNTSESNLNTSSDQTTEPLSVDRLLDRPAALDRLVDRLHYELDRKHRRERERRGL